MELVADIGYCKLSNKHKYLFKCPECGNEVESNLRDGTLEKRCAKCYRASFSGKGNPNHRHGGKLGSQKLYNVWQNMRRRCQDAKNKKYYRYGGRGICVCDEWQDFAKFQLWAVLHGWVDGLTIDRIDIDGNYCPENCRFITLAENSKYKSTTKISDQKAEIVRRICSAGAARKDVAALLDVSGGTIAAIMTGKTHNNINPV